MVRLVLSEVEALSKARATSEITDSLDVWFGDVTWLEGVEQSLSEWLSAADDEAYADL